MFQTYLAGQEIFPFFLGFLLIEDRMKKKPYISNKENRADKFKFS